VALESESFRAEVAEATEEFVRSRQHGLIERFRESQGRDGASVGGAAEVAQALDRGQVEELIFVSGQEPSAIEDLFRQALGTDAGIFALGQEEDQDDLPEGIGAMLRWRDDATPSNRVGSMTGDTERQEAVTPERDEPSPHAQEEQSLRTCAPQPDGPPPRPLAVVIPGWGHGCLPAPALQGIGTERGQVMPEAWNKKRERQYQHVKDSAEG